MIPTPENHSSGHHLRCKITILSDMSGYSRYMMSLTENVYSSSLKPELLLGLAVLLISILEVPSVVDLLIGTPGALTLLGGGGVNENGDIESGDSRLLLASGLRNPDPNPEYRGAGDSADGRRLGDIALGGRLAFDGMRRRGIGDGVGDTGLRFGEGGAMIPCMESLRFRERRRGMESSDKVSHNDLNNDPLGR